ncbi:MAG: hypothetical protein ACYC1P_00830 [Gaiellaceae bacterium]
MNELEELNRLADSFAATIRSQGQQLESGLRTVSAALDAAAARLAAAITGGAPVPAAPPAAAAPAVGGLAAVRIVNERGAPVPVFVVNAPAPAEGGGGGLLQSILSGAGGFVGNLIGGIGAGFATPFLLLADIVALMAGLPGIIDRLSGLLRDIRAFGRELVAGVRGLIVLLFSELTAAGIFPVARLIASLLFLIDRGITLVLMHVHPIIVWLERLVEAVTDWLGRYIQRLSAWLGSFITALGSWLASFITYVLDSIVRPFVDTLVTDMLRSLVAALTGMFLGALAALGEVLIAGGVWIAGQIERVLIQFWNMLPGTTPVAVPSVASPDFGAVASRGYRGGMEAGRLIAEGLLGPTPTRPRPGSGAAGAPPGTPPVFRGPGFRAPELRLPDMPGPGPRLEELLTSPPTAEPAPVRPQPVTVNGGVSVAIRSETVSMDNAEATARVIATHLVDELARLTQADRFGRGLPTSSVA